MDSAPTPLLSNTADAHVTAVLRALSLLDAFDVLDAQLPLAELAKRTGLAKPTALRLARTLAAANYLVQLEGGSWRLGPAAARLGAQYQRSFDLLNVIEPALQELAQTTGHSASFFTIEQGRRVRLLRVRGKDGFVSTSRVGESLPLERGSAGQVILAYQGKKGAINDAIRARGYHLTVGEADATAASLAAPIFAARNGVLGALSITVRAEAAAAEELERHAPIVVASAARLSQTLAASRYFPGDKGSLRGFWHP